MNKFLLIVLIIIIVLKYLETDITDKLIESHSRDIYYLKNFYPNKLKNKIKKIVFKNKEEKYRMNTYIRNGSSISHHQMFNTEYEDIIDIFRDARTLNIIRKKTGMNLQIIPRTDPSHLSILFYENAGDGIAWHNDNDMYEGTKWTCIYTIVNDGFNKGKSHATFKYKKNNKEYSINTEANSLLMFKGSKIEHMISDLKKNEKRIVVSFVLCDVCSMKQNLVNYFYSKIINFSFYGKIY
tara:strand:- start:449 stop:1165 length:717 start_codon:yes stop_codon:yes gene_type:complete